MALVVSATLVASALVGCASRAPSALGVDDPLVASGVDQAATLAAFAVCHGYGCAAVHLIGLEAAQTAHLRALFEPAPTSAAAERQRIAQAIAYLEQVTGERLGTSADRPRTPHGGGDPNQLDCVDESINTSTYLHALAHAGWIRWHTIGTPARRYRWLNFGVHYTAVIHEADQGGGGRAYAVDAWFHANGVPPEVVDLARWRSGWMPEH